MNANNKDASSSAFLNGGGQIGALIRAHDWSTSPLGHPAIWPQPLRTVVELLLNSKFPMCLAWGSELGFLYNDAYVEIMGAKHPAGLGRPLYEVWSEVWGDIKPLVERALQGESTFNERLALTLRRHEYEERAWFTFSYSPVRDDSGKVAGMYCACMEVTDQVLAEEYRFEENERLRALFDQAPGFMAILHGPNHVFELANQAYCEHIGHRKILGKTVRAALSELAGQGFYELLDDVYASGKPFVGHALPVKLWRGSNGPLEERFVDFVYQPIRNAHGNVTGIFVEGNDVTERKQVEEKLRQLAVSLAQANQRQSEFLATLAHELRNPLAPIRTGLDLMRMAGDNPASIAKVRQTIERQVDHLVHLVNDLLDMARISTGKIEFKKTRVRVGDFILTAVETALPSIEAKKQQFSMQLPDVPIWLDVDVNRMVQVVANVLTNARKYTPEHGRINLSVRREEDDAVIAVVDNGIGIPEDALPRIFDLFSQVRNGINQSEGGLGIGLNLVKRLTEKHGGSVSASSTGPGQETTITIRLPMAKPDVDEAAATRAKASNSPLEKGGLRILVADDNQDAAELLKAVLEIHAHMVETAYDGMAAMEKAKTFRPDVALVDIGMPVMDGYGFAKAIRQEPQLASIRLVAVTGWGTQEDQERTKQAGFDYHLTKPVSFEALDKLLSKILAATQD